MRNIILGILLAAPLCAQVNPTSTGNDAGGSASNTSSTFTYPNSVASGDTLILDFIADGSTTLTVTSVGDTVNTWANACKQQGTTNNEEIWYASNVAAHAAGLVVTVHVSANLTWFSYIHELHNIKLSSPVDVCKGNTGSASTYTTGNFTTAGANDYIVASMATSSGSTIVAGTGYTLLSTQHVNNVNAVDEGGALAAGTNAATASAASTNYSMLAAGFLPLVPADYTISGATTGYVGTASSNITWTKATGNWSSCTLTVSDGAQGGTWGGSMSGTSTGTFLANGISTFNATYQAAVAGSITFTFTNSCSEINPNPVTFTSSQPSISISGPASGNLGAASTNFTVSLTGATFNGARTVTVCDNSYGTLTPSVGSPGVNCVVVTPASGTSFTSTYTPATVGVRNLTLANAQGWTNGSAAAYTVTSTDVCTFTASADGNDNSAGTWTASGCTGGGHTTPHSGDTRVITAHHVTVPAGVTAFGGTCPGNNTTYDLQLTPSGGTSGWFEVAGTATYLHCGNIQLKAPSTSNPTSFGIFQIDTGGTFNPDLNGSVNYRLTTSTTSGWNNLKIGTSGDTCTPGASYSCPTNVVPVNVGTNGFILGDTNSTPDSLTNQIYGTAIKAGCGTATAHCLMLSSNGVSNSYANAGITDIENSYLDGTGNIGAGAANGVNTTVTALTLKNVRTINDLIGPFHVGAGGQAGSLAKPCTISGNYFAGGWNSASNMQLGACVFTNNMFADSVDPSNMGGTNPGAAISFNWNTVIINSASVDWPEDTGFTANYYVFNGNAVGSAHFTSNTISTSAVNTFSSIYESLDPTGTEGHCGGSASVISTAAWHYLGNLSIAGKSGNNSCQGQVTTVNASNAPVISADHNGMFGLGGGIAWFMFTGHSATLFASNQNVRNYRSNLHWGPSASANNFPLSTESDSYSVAPCNNYNVAGIGWNLIFNGATSGTLSNGNCTSSSSSTHYNIFTASGTPGQHDITIDPKPLDTTRNLSKWANTFHGQAASLAGALTAFVQCPDIGYCNAELRRYVSTGYQPTASGVRGQSHDGYVVGVTGSLGAGSGTCTVGNSGVPVNADSDDLGLGASLTCGFAGGNVFFTVTNPGQYYRIATPAQISWTGSITGSGTVSVMVMPMDPGPVLMWLADVAGPSVAP